MWIGDRSSISKTALQASLGALVVLLGLSPAQARPPMFEPLSLAQAQTKARHAHKYVVADATATWCGPCHMMDETTWVDPQVEQWMRRNAIAVQVDVDADKAVAIGLNISAMPTVVVFSRSDPDHETARKTGYQDPEDLLAWLAAVEKDGGSPAAVAAMRYERFKGKGGVKEVAARLKRGEVELSNKRFDAATEEFVWLWQNMGSEAPEMLAVRDSELVAAIADLVVQYPPAAEKFNQLRAQAHNEHAIFDWMLLNEITGHDDDTVSWFDSVKDDRSKRGMLMDLGPRLPELLIARGRYADAGRLYGDPSAELHARYEWSRQLTPSAAVSGSRFPKLAAVLYQSLLAAGRNEDAQVVFKESLNLENSKAMRDELQSAADKGSSILNVINNLPPYLLPVAALLLLLGGILLFRAEQKKKAKA